MHPVSWVLNHFQTQATGNSHRVSFLRMNCTAPGTEGMGVVTVLEYHQA